MILLTRKAEFSAAHYYWNEAWSAAENERVFGKCANRNGHGHNYTLDLKQLKDVMHSEVVDVYDHRHLNLEIPEFRDRVPTVENIAVSAWKRLDGKIAGAKLERVRVYETPNLYADCFGPEGVR
jgi:6-pyruvoyltetrahydropterin/6-carboxytetrahydropterin synthase